VVADFERTIGGGKKGKKSKRFQPSQDVLRIGKVRRGVFPATGPKKREGEGWAKCIMRPKMKRETLLTDLSSRVRKNSQVALQK